MCLLTEEYRHVYLDFLRRKCNPPAIPAVGASDPNLLGTAVVLVNMQAVVDKKALRAALGSDGRREEFMPDCPDGAFMLG